MTRKRRRLYFVLAGMTGLGVATALVLSAFRNNIVFFYSPSQIVAQHIAPGERIRLGGLVAAHSVVHEGDTTLFVVTDKARSLKVTYTGLLPDLFREGQGVVAEGRIGANGVFIADQVLAKHDEKYMPPGVVAALKASGHWQEGGGGAAPAARAADAAAAVPAADAAKGYGK